MTFSEAIDKVMPEVESGSKEPFIIYRDSNGDWQCDFTQNQYGEKFDWVEDVEKSDPFAVTMTGEDLSNGSFSYVYDRIFNERLQNEYGNAVFTNTDLSELKALINLVEENFGEFSSEVADYLTMYDRPLVALYEMKPHDLSLVSDDPDDDYDYSKVDDFIQAVESEIDDRLHNRKKEVIPAGLEGSEIPGKRNIDGYEEKICIEFAGKQVILAENQTYLDPYLICNIKYDNLLGMEERYDGVVTDNYVEAMRVFVNRVDSLVEQLETERLESGLPFQTLSAVEHCISDSYKADYEGKLVVIRPEILAPEYRSAEHQLAIVTGGFGANPEARGRAVFVEELHSGAKKRYDRTQIAGLANLQKIPAWSVDKLLEHLKKDRLSTDNVNLDEMSRHEKAKAEPAKKPATLQEKLDKAKKKAAEQSVVKKDEHGDKPKKRGERE